MDAPIRIREAPVGYMVSAPWSREHPKGTVRRHEHRKDDVRYDFFRDKGGFVQNGEVDRKTSKRIPIPPGGKA